MTFQAKKDRGILWPLLHVVAWLLIIGGGWGILALYLPTGFVLWKIFLASLFLVSLFYLTSELLVPRFFERGLYLQMTLYSLGILFAFVLLRYQIEEVWLHAKFREMDIGSMDDRVQLLHEFPWLRYALSSISTFLLACFYRLVYAEVLRQNRESELRALKYETDLKQLLHQINPHFLFNTLNNIYTLAMVKDDRTAPMLLKLSDMLRTTLYQSEKDFIPLKKELDLINNVLDIYSLKYDPMPLAKIKADKNPMVPPLLFLPIIENMFKHGDASRPELWKMEFELRKGSMHFETQNPVARSPIHSGEGSGIGLANVEKRLQLLFEGEYDFESRQEGELFKVRIKFPVT